MTDELRARLRALESLSYASECMLVHANGEAKDELRGLARKLRKDAAFDFPEAREVATLVARVPNLMGSGRDGEAASTLGRATRGVWEPVLEQLKAG